MKRFFMIAVLMLCTTVLALAQTIKVHGTVMDKGFGEPVPGALSSKWVLPTVQLPIWMVTSSLKFRRVPPFSSATSATPQFCFLRNQ